MIVGSVRLGQGRPDEPGVYACRVPSPYGHDLLDDELLVWMHGRWSHVGSDQEYRGEVRQWAGPLPRRIAQ